MATETKVLNCINCPLSCELTATVEDGVVTNVTGNFCPRGAQYAKEELTAPTRMLTSTVRVDGGRLPLLPFPSVSLNSSYGVTPRTSQMISIFSETGSVFFRFQSLTVLCAIPVSSENFFWLIPRASRRLNIFSDIVIANSLHILIKQAYT